MYKRQIWFGHCTKQEIIMLSKFKILLLNVNRDGWHSGNMIYDMEVIKKACDTKIYGPGWPEYKNVDIREIIKQLYGDDKPDIIYSYFYNNERVGDTYMQHYQIPETSRFFPTHLEKIRDITKIFAISDFWQQKDQALIGQSNFQYCFGCFVPPYSNPKDFYAFFSEENQKKMKFIPCPRCIDRDCYKDYGLFKKYDVISVGAMWHFYPLRVFMHNYLTQYAEKLGIRYRNYPHCGINFSHNDFVREKYAMTINGSKMLISCGGRYHVAMNKIFEAMGCNTAYVGEKPYGEEELHLRDGYNYIAVAGEDFIGKIQHYLKSEDALSYITKNAKDTFEKYHHIDARANDFEKLIKGILNEA